jgi:hypothetical protein
MHCFLNAVKSSSLLAATGECNTFLPAILGAENSNMSRSKEWLGAYEGSQADGSDASHTLSNTLRKGPAKYREDFLKLFLRVK